MIKSNGTPISSEPMKVNTKRLNDLGLISLTSDLFGIEPCPNCDGSGKIESIEEERIEDCDICNGDQ